jgi:hypothetical protein
MTLPDRAADRLIFHTAAVSCRQCVCITLEMFNGAACGSYMAAVVPFETVSASYVLVLRVPASCDVAPVQCRQRGTARKSILGTAVDDGRMSDSGVFSCDGAASCR